MWNEAGMEVVIDIMDIDTIEVICKKVAAIQLITELQLEIVNDNEN